MNIHFTGAPGRDLDGLGQMGVRWIRMDFYWAGIEKTKGVYDFSAYDTLVAGLAAHHIRPLFILDYENSLYEQGSPSTPEARAAFARFAAASATHFAKAGVIWEIWNEPNIGFWKPAPNANDYAALAVETAQAIKKAEPNATVIAPATSTIDLGFMETCFQAGLLKYIDAVSFHPYRGASPETAAADYAKVRALVARYEPAGRQIDLVSSEWGYSTAGVSEEQQAQYLTREWLSNLEQGIKVSIWYDWHDDGTDPKNGEHNFGAVNWDYSPKPAFVAARTLTHTLDGYRFVKRVVTPSDADYVLIFRKGKSYKLAAWTTGPDHLIQIPFIGPANLTLMLGDSQRISSSAGVLNLPVSQSPEYVDVPSGNTVIALDAGLTIDPVFGAYAGKDPMLTVRISNPLNKPIRGTWAVDGTGAADSVFGPIPPGHTLTMRVPVLGARTTLNIAATAEVWIGKRRVRNFSAAGEMVPTDPLSFAMAPLGPNAYGFLVSNPAGEPFAGEMDISWEGREVEAWVRVPSGEREKTIIVNNGAAPPMAQVAVRIAGEDSGASISLPQCAFTPAAGEPSDWTAALDGDPKVQSKVDLSVVTAPAPVNAPAAKLDYAFGSGWSFVRVFDREAKPLPGKPTGETIWVYGDGSGNALRARFVDSTGQTFQDDFEKCDWQGWRPVACSFDGANHWGGANDGVIHYPIRIDTLFLLDSTSPDHKQGTLIIYDPEIVYGK